MMLFHRKPFYFLWIGKVPIFSCRLGHHFLKLDRAERMLFSERNTNFSGTKVFKLGKLYLAYGRFVKR